MVLPTFRSFESISHLSSDAFPILQTASVGSIKKDPIPSSPWEFLTLLTASSLRRVSISSAYKLPALKLPWAYLTNLEIDTAYEYTPPGPAEEPALTEYDILSMLRPCLALQTCDLDIDITDALDQIHEPVPVSLLHLRHLGVSLKRHCSPGRLFSKLVLPNLRSLNLSSAPDNRPLPSCVFFPSLEHLSLGIRLQDSTGLFRNLKLVPRLTELEIHGELVLPRAEEWARFEPDADFLARFAPDGEPAICPNLSRLRLYFFKALSDDALLAFIQSRTGPARGAVAHLTHVTARLPRKMQRDILEPLQPLIADGLQISLVWD
jgi:hypothetical protein